MTVFSLTFRGIRALSLSKQMASSRQRATSAMKRAQPSFHAGCTVLSHFLLFIAPVDAFAQGSEATAEFRFNISPQPIEDALAEFARQTHVNIAFRTQTVGTVRTVGVSGVHTPNTALPILLEGTGLGAIFTGPRSAIIYSLHAPALSTGTRTHESRPFIELDTAQVRAQRIIGKPITNFASLDYARHAEARIRAILSTSLGYRGAPFRARIGVTADQNGRVTHILVIRSNAKSSRDDEVRALLVGEELGRPPPDGIRQPMWFRISTDELFDVRRTQAQ